MKRILIVILALLVWMAAAAAESAGEDAMLVHLAEGEMTVRDAEGNILASEADMSVFSGYSVETGDDSYAYIYLDDGKTVKLDMNTLVTVSRSGGKALVELKSGQLAFFLTAPLGEDGEFLIRAGELETSVLGSSGIVTLRKVIYGTGHGIIYQADENGMLPRSFDIWGGQLLELNGEQDGTRIENAQVSDIPSVYLKEVEQNEILQQSLQEEGNYDVDELIAMAPVAEEREQTARDAAAAAVVQPPSDDAATNPAFTIDEGDSGSRHEPINPVVPVVPVVPDVPDFETVTVRWKNGSEILAEERVVKGSIPKYSGYEPTREADAQYTYTFIGWDHDEKQVYENTVYYAEFKSTLRKYTIIWKNDDGTVIDTWELEYGSDAPEHDTPVKEATAGSTYTFTGWTPAVADVTGDAVYTATYSEAKNFYTITWKNDDGSVIDTTTAAYGATPEHAAPEKAATAEYTYTFTGWDPAVAEVAGDATYTAKFSETKKTYTITWKNDDGTVIDTTTVQYGATPEHAAPEKAATAEYTYTFTGWDPAVATVAGDAAYKAVYSEAARTYTITWTQDDGAVIDTMTVEYGVVPKHANAAKAATAEYTYTFTGWDPAVAAVAGDETYKAVYDAAKNSYTITWTQDDGTLIDTTTVEYGATPEHDDAEKKATAEVYYTFAGWEPAVAAVTGDATYMATYTSEKAYTIRWMNWNETLLKEEYLPAGRTPNHEGPELKDPETGELYTFVGWRPAPYPVSENQDYYPRYSEFEESVEPIVEGEEPIDEGGVSGTGE